MQSSLWIAVGLLGIVRGITVDDFYPFNPLKDAKVANGDSESSHRIDLSVPTKFYNNEYNYLWINTDGYITFEPYTSDVTEADFPFREALLSPYMSNLDTTNRGDIFYQESHDTGVLRRATNDVKLAFPRAAATFSAESAFIVTWYNVEGQSSAGDTAVFTFQCIIVSNGRDSFAIFLYPENRMGVFPEGVKQKSTVFHAKTGFNEGGSNFLEMYPVDSLVDHKNTRHHGEWIFQIGGEEVRRRRDVIAPERSRHQKRQALINVQEVDLEGEDDVENEEEEVPTVRSEPPDYCSHYRDACLAENSHCFNHDTGYCCRCDDGFFGNGKVCLAEGSPVRVNGNITGSVDVRYPNGRVDRISLENTTFHSFVITDQGRAYSAVSGIQESLGLALQPISTMGEIIGWIFAVPSGAAVNGFQYTGGSFQRMVRIRFNDDNGAQFDMRQRFSGVHHNKSENIVIVQTSLVGVLPAIPMDVPVVMDDYVQDYTKEAPGRITSRSVRHYSVDGTKYSYNIEESIVYSGCENSLRHIPNNLKLHVSGIYLSYSKEEEVARYAMNDRVAGPDAGHHPSHPCATGTHNCDSNAKCEPTEGEGFTCRCESGFVGDGNVCDDFDECVRDPCHESAVCRNVFGSYSCHCRDGYEMNAERECEEQNRTCDDPYTCGDATCVVFEDTYDCQCDQGFYFDGGRCLDIDECSDGTSTCAYDATCYNTEGSFRCTCNVGFTGNGEICSEIKCPGNQIFSTCAGCFTTCEERHRPKLCTLQCRVQCTCPPNTFLNGDMCVRDHECPAELTLCQREAARASAILNGPDPPQDGPEGPSCDENGNFTPKQCIDFVNVCRCVVPETGAEIPNTRTREDEGHLLDCSITECPGNQIFSTCAGCFTTCEERHRPKLCTLQCRVQCTCPPNTFLNGDMCVRDHECPAGTVVVPPVLPPRLTPCQRARQDAMSRESPRGRPAHAPLCTAAGAYEPIQYYAEGGYFVCVDGDGREVSRHPTQPKCLTDCQLQAYYAETSNRFVETINFVPQCTENGDFSRVQCDHVSETCYCVNQNGEEIPRTSQTVRSDLVVTEEFLECDRFDPPHRNERIFEQVIFAQSSGLNIEDLPINRDSSATRLYSQAGSTVVGVAFDCNNKKVYWTDVARKRINVAPINDISAKTSLINHGLGSPEGIAVDVLSGNVYWTDSRNKNIEVVSKDGSHRTVLVQSHDLNDAIDKGLRNPRGIALDPFGGKMYWTDWNRNNPKIMKANMDGSNVTVFIKEGLRLPNDITIDLFPRRLCFIDDLSKKIECMNLDGTNRTVVHNIPSSGLSRVFGLAVGNGNVYYTDRDREQLNVVSMATNKNIQVRGPPGAHGHMYGVALIQRDCPFGYNGCSRTNGGCPNLCLPKENGRTCTKQ